MASQDRSEAAALKDELLAQPKSFSFFQAVRILMHRSGNAVAPIGEDAALEDEAVRLRATRSQAFAPTDVSQIVVKSPRDAPGSERPELFVNFIGLFGPKGALPRQYTRHLVRGDDSERDHLHDFLDLFNHRVASLFYRAWSKHRFSVGYERWRREVGPRQRDMFSFALQALTGLGTGSLACRRSFDDDVQLYWGGYFAHYPRSAAGLEAIVQEWLTAPARVVQLRGDWLRLPPDERLSLGAGASGGLGTCVIGSRVWSVESKVLIRVGPVGIDQFRTLSPGGPQLRELSELARTYLGPVLEFDVQVVLRAHETPRTRLTARGDSRLGVDSWLISTTPARDVDDAVFRPGGWPSSP